MAGETVALGAHPKNGEHFLIGRDLAFNVRYLFGIGETPAVF